MIDASRSDGIAIVRMTHGKVNAMDVEFLAALEAALRTEANGDARAVVLSGRGTVFSAGVDLVRLVEGGRNYLKKFLPALNACFHTLFHLPKPVVAAVNGHAIAGGCILTCASDHRIMARGTGRIGAPELLVGVPFPLMPLEIVRFATGHGAQEIAYSDRTYRPEEALERHLVDELCDEGELFDRAKDAAARLAAIPPVSFRLTKAALRRPVEDTWQRHGAAAEAAVLEAWASDEVLGAVRAYVEKTLRK